MTDLLTRIRAHVAQIPPHTADIPADALLREVAALEPVGFATHHDEPMLFPTEEEARMYCSDDEVPRGLYTLTGDSHDR